MGLIKHHFHWLFLPRLLGILIFITSRTIFDYLFFVTFERTKNIHKFTVKLANTLAVFWKCSEVITSKMVTFWSNCSTSLGFNIFKWKCNHSIYEPDHGQICRDATSQYILLKEHKSDYKSKLFIGWTFSYLALFGYCTYVLTNQSSIMSVRPNSVLGSNL